MDYFEGAQSPELKFWKTFFEKAIQDLYSIKAKYRRTAYQWINSDSEGVASFRWVCSQFNLRH